MALFVAETLCCCADEYATRAAYLLAELQSNVADRQKMAVDEIVRCFLCDDGRLYQEAQISAGVVSQLVAMLSADQPDINKLAAYALGRVAVVQQGVDAVTAAGALPLLVAMLRSFHAAVQDGAAETLYMLAAGIQLTKDDIIAAGALPVLGAMLRSDQPDVQLTAAYTVVLTRSWMTTLQLAP